MSQSSTKSQSGAAARETQTLPVAMETKWHSMSLRVPDALYRRFKVHCVMNRLRMQDLSIELIEKFLASESRAA